VTSASSARGVFGETSAAVAIYGYW